MGFVKGYRENKCKMLLAELKEGKKITKKYYNNFIKNLEKELAETENFLLNVSVPDFKLIFQKYLEVRDTKEWKKLEECHKFIVMTDEIYSVYDSYTWYLNINTDKFIKDLYKDTLEKISLYEENIKNNVSFTNNIEKLRFFQTVQVLGSEYKRGYNQYNKDYYEMLKKSLKNIENIKANARKIRVSPYYMLYRVYHGLKSVCPDEFKTMRWFVSAKDSYKELMEYCEKHQKVFTDSVSR